MRDDPSAPILTLSSVGQAVFPYVYGYPLYPKGDDARGIPNWDGARQSEVDDDAGVRHASEERAVLRQQRLLAEAEHERELAEKQRVFAQYERQQREASQPSAAGPGVTPATQRWLARQWRELSQP